MANIPEIIKNHRTQEDIDYLIESYRQLAQYVEQGVNGREIPLDTFKESAEQQIEMGEEYLETQEPKTIPGEQTDTGQPFVLDSDFKANELIREGAVAYAVFSTYKYLKEGGIMPNLVRDFIEVSGLDREAERRRLAGVYGEDELGDFADDTKLEFPDELKVNTKFIKRGW